MTTHALPPSVQPATATTQQQQPPVSFSQAPQANDLQELSRHMREGLALLKEGQGEQAEARFREVIRQMPNSAGAHYNLGLALAAQDRRREAGQAYLHAFELDNKLAVALNNLALLHRKEGENALAQQYLERAVIAQPTLAMAWLNLGNVYADTGLIDQALASFRRAAQVQAELMPAWLRISELERGRGHYEAAAHAARSALLIHPQDFHAKAQWYCAQRLIAKGQSRADEMLTAWLEALPPQERLLLLEGIGHLQPESVPQAFAVLPSKDFENEHTQRAGEMLAQWGEGALASEYLERALKNQEPSVNLLVARGIAAIQVNQDDVARRMFTQAQKMDPNHAEPKFNLALLDLLQQRWRDAWKGYESRRDPRRAAQVTLDLETSKPRWAGEDLAGKTILVIREQGLGDIFMYSRYVRDLVSRAAKVKLAVFAPQAEILRSLHPQVEIIGIATAEDIQAISYDTWVHALSLPLYLDIAAPVAATAYLRADEGLKQGWQSRFETAMGEIAWNKQLRVGLVWSGGPHHPVNAHRNIALKKFECLAQVPGVSFHGFVVGPDAQQVHEVSDELWVYNWGTHLTDFSQTAAALSHMDVIITVDTSVAHLSGALGLPVWVLMGKSYYSPLRTIPAHQNSAWYESMRIFTQGPHDEGWDNVFKSVLRELKAITTSRGRKPLRMAKSARLA